MTIDRLPAAGFSLLETIVAAAIVAVAFSVAFSGISTSARGTERIDAFDRREEAARSIFAAIDLVDRITPGDRAQGTTPDGFIWRIETREFIPPAPGRTSAVIEIQLDIDPPEGLEGPTWSIPSYRTIPTGVVTPPVQEQLQEQLDDLL